MSQEKNLLQEAILAAKQVRAAAVKNAVKGLEESLTPSIKAMLAQKLEEEVVPSVPAPPATSSRKTEDTEMNESEDDDESIEENTTSGFKEVKHKKSLTEEDDNDDKSTEDEPDGEEDGGEAHGNHPEPDGDEPEEDEESEDDEEPDGDEDGGEAHGNHSEPDGDEPEETDGKEKLDDDTELKDITLGDLKDVIADIIAQVNGTEGNVAPGGNEGVDMQPADVQGAGEEDAPLEDTEPISDENKDDDNDEIDLSEILKALEEDQKVEKNRRVVNNSQDSKEISNLRRENKEYKKAVKELKESLQGTNLLNAKLLYATRMMGKRNLTEAQKVRVIRSFDVASTPEEVKIVYNTLNESLDAEVKKNVMQRSGRPASSVVTEALQGRVGGSTAPTKILAVDPMVRRFQQLAGVID